MRVTKHEHATLRIEKDGATLVVDPGNFTVPLDDLENVVGVVVTHEHPDHWTPEQLEAILDRFPGAPVFSTRAVADAAPVDIDVVEPGQRISTGPFSLEFFGGRHNEIHSSVPIVDNLGVLVDDIFYYPGDSYAIPDGHAVRLLAAPIGAPWLKIGEAMDFLLAVAPAAAFGTHDVPLSPQGLAMHRGRLRWATEQHGGVFHELDPGDAVEV